MNCRFNKFRFALIGTAAAALMFGGCERRPLDVASGDELTAYEMRVDSLRAQYDKAQKVVSLSW